MCTAPFVFRQFDLNIVDYNLNPVNSIWYYALALWASGIYYDETGRFDPELVRKLAKPEKFSKPMVLISKVLLRTKPFRFGWDRMLKENGAYERRFDRPYVSGSESQIAHIEEPLNKMTDC